MRVLWVAASSVLDLGHVDAHIFVFRVEVQHIHFFFFWWLRLCLRCSWCSQATGQKFTRFSLWWSWSKAC